MNVPESAPGKRWSGWSLLQPVLILVVGILAAIWQAGQVGQQMRDDLLLAAERLANTLNPKRLAILTGTEADLEKAEYQRLKSQLQAARHANPDWRFIYLMSQRPDKAIVFHIDSEPPGSEDESLPGEVYEEGFLAEELLVFDPGIGLTTRPSEDRWGKWITALVPVPKVEDSPVRLALGIDIDIGDWRRQVLLKGAAPIILPTLLLVGLNLVGQLLIRRRRVGDAGNGRVLRHLEPILVLAVGLVLTATASWFAHTEGQRSQARAFQLAADASVQRIVTELRNLRDFGLGGMVRFIEASESVSKEEFVHYTELLVQAGLPAHWAWAPRVPVGERESFERRTREQGIPDFHIWARSPDGSMQPPGQDAEFLYPVTLQARPLPEIDLIGFDLASVDQVRTALESARRTGLITLASMQPGQMLVMEPITTRLKAAAPDGVVITNLYLEQIVSMWADGNSLAMDLWLLDEHGVREELARSGSRASFDTATWMIERPIPIFGKTFLVRAAPGPGFVATHRSLAGPATALAGISLSLMLALVISLLTRGRERLEQAVRERTLALQEFQAAVEQSNDGIALIDLDGRVQYVNRAWAQMHGQDAQAYVGQDMRVFHSPEQFEKELSPNVADMLRDGFALSEVGHIDGQGSSFPTRMSSSLIRNDRGQPYRMLAIAREISEEYQRRQREQFNQRFRSLVAEISADFINAVDQARFDRVINRALAALGDLFGFDRTCLFRFSDDLTTMSNTHEWCAPGMTAHRHELQSTPTATLPWWMERMRAQRQLVIEDVAELPDEAKAERRSFQRRSTRSLISLAVLYPQDQLIGLLCFDSVHQTRNWSSEQIDMLKVIADILAGAMARREAQLALAESDDRFRKLAQEGRSFRWVVDLDGLYTDLDPLVEDILGYRPEDLIGHTHFFDLAPETDCEALRRISLRLIREGQRRTGHENRVVSRDGRTLWFSSTILPLHDAQGRIIGASGSHTDITARKQAELQLEYLAQHDLLTGLPNRTLLAERMQQAMTRAEDLGELLGVACIDLDAFKPINDRYGHEVGDRLLVILAERMRKALREGDTVARLGGDEFALVLVGLDSADTCEPLLRRVLDAIAEPIDEDGLILQVSVSMGVTFFPQAEPIDADQLLRQADQAMYAAKLAGKNRFRLFDDEHDRRLRDTHQSIERMRQGLLANEFVLHYQPKVDMQKGRVIGLEALIRWQHPERGLLKPHAFLQALEKNRLMIKLGNWAIEQILKQITQWRAAGVCLPVSINVDPLQLAQADFIEGLRQVLDRYPAVQPGDIELEVLETSALDEALPVVDIIRAGKALGVEFALDDFGTGYSSLAYLKRLPVPTLKIDRGFVHDMLRDPDDLAILQGVISLSRAFRRSVIAEGVETEAHGEMLLRLGCRLGQGYAIARPMPAAAIPAWLAQWRAPASWSRTHPVCQPGAIQYRFELL